MRAPPPLSDLARLLVPVECPGCGLPDEPWCEECRAPWWEAPVRCESGAPRLDGLDPPLPVWAVAPLEGAAHGVLAAWKDAGRRDLDRELAGTMRRAARAVAPALAGVGPVAVVPCPARRAHTRRRGVDLPGMLADAAAQGLADAAVPARAARLLGAPSTRSRGAGDRGRWRAAPPTLRAAVGRVAGTVAAVLVDDVVTTGATLARAVDTFAGTRIVPVAGMALASAPMVRAGPASALGWVSQDDDRHDTFQARG